MKGRIVSEQRLLRICDVCGQVDNHPRHIVGLDFVSIDSRPETVQSNVTKVVEMETLSTEDKVRIIGEIQDTTTLQRHIDCCASVGCPDASCPQIVASSGGLKGDKLVKHLSGTGK